MGDKTALQYFRDEKLAAGWNLGNTLDAYTGGKSGETLWGNPRVNQALMDGIKAAGFDLVRIPVTWMGHIGPAPDCHIDEKWMRRVGEVAGMAHNAGLKVIINLHHDGSTASTTQENGWLSVTKARKSVKEYNRITQRFIRVWKQIAVYFKNHGDWLMFESMNEIHDGNWGWGDPDELDPQIKMVNEWNQYFSDVVRNSGGNNAERYLIFPGYSTSPRHTLAPYFVLPQDGVPGRQIVTFHYYDPYQFGIEGKVSTWGSDDDIRQIDADFEPFKAAFIDKGIPVIIGEAGAVRQIYPGNADKEAQARASRIAYLSHIFATAQKYGLVPLYWDNGAATGDGEKFGLFNRANGQPNSEDSRILINAMIIAARK
jgi:endoglucanase